MLVKVIPFNPRYKVSRCGVVINAKTERRVKVTNNRVKLLAMDNKSSSISIHKLTEQVWGKDALIRKDKW